MQIVAEFTLGSGVALAQNSVGQLSSPTTWSQHAKPVDLGRHSQDVRFEDMGCAASGGAGQFTLTPYLDRVPAEVRDGDLSGQVNVSGVKRVSRS